MDILSDLLKLVVPGGLVLYGMYLTVKLLLEREAEKYQIEQRNRFADTILPLRLQAYERMTLFLERITPNNLLLRLNGQTLTVLDFQQLLLQEIRDEYNHNVSQQVYMSHRLWEQIAAAQNELIALINQSAAEVSPDAPMLDLSKKIFDKIIQQNLHPTGPALRALKEEVEQIFL